VFLDGSGSNSGVARGDTYSNIEIVRGAARFADRITGSSQEDVLIGLGGNDRLNGRSQGDDLTGGRGADTLTGGATAGDQFIYNSKADGRDSITDFSGVAGEGDRFEIRAAGFGGGLDIGTLDASQFRSRGNNRAIDGNDRFIFRTTDTTLWFDADGRGGKGPVLIADLQAGAEMAYNDIRII
jgi:Ca2+-binding RTX toxin-like protein